MKAFTFSKMGKLSYVGPEGSLNIFSPSLARERTRFSICLLCVVSVYYTHIHLYGRGQPKPAVHSHTTKTTWCKQEREREIGVSRCVYCAGQRRHHPSLVQKRRSYITLTQYWMLLGRPCCLSLAASPCFCGGAAAGGAHSGVVVNKWEEHVTMVLVQRGTCVPGWI